MKVSTQVFRNVFAAAATALVISAPAHADSSDARLIELAAQDPSFFEIKSDSSRELSDAEVAQDPDDFMPMSVLAGPGDPPAKPAQTKPNTTQQATDIIKEVIGNPKSGTPLDKVEVIINQIIRIGSKIYKIVEAGKPVYSYSTCRTDVVPQGISNWMQLSNWQTPMSRRYERTIKNAYGMTVVYLRYRIEYTPGGSYNGKGRFLQAVTILPESVYVAWGYNMDVTVSVPSVSNAGSSTSPIAAAQLLIASNVSTIINTSQNTESYYVRGDGVFKSMQN